MCAHSAGAASGSAIPTPPPPHNNLPPELTGAPVVWTCHLPGPPCIPLAYNLPVCYTPTSLPSPYCWRAGHLGQHSCPSPFSQPSCTILCLSIGGKEGGHREDCPRACCSYPHSFSSAGRYISLPSCSSYGMRGKPARWHFWRWNSHTQQTGRRGRRSVVDGISLSDCQTQSVRLARTHARTRQTSLHRAYASPAAPDGPLPLGASSALQVDPPPPADSPIWRPLLSTVSLHSSILSSLPTGCLGTFLHAFPPPPTCLASCHHTALTLHGLLHCHTTMVHIHHALHHLLAFYLTLHSHLHPHFCLQTYTSAFPWGACPSILLVQPCTPFTHPPPSSPLRTGHTLPPAARRCHLRVPWVLRITGRAFIQIPTFMPPTGVLPLLPPIPHTTGHAGSG